MKGVLLPWLLVGCTLLVTVWLVMARRSARPFQPFDLTAADFGDFRPLVPGWSVRALPVSTNDPAEPNILAYEVTSAGRESPPVRLLVRLVHGYNMPMCMKIKGYEVRSIGDCRSQANAPPTPARLPDARVGHGGGAYAHEPLGLPHQRWCVTSSAGDVSIWVTSMLRAGDFKATDVDICAMAFPRVDVPDDPRWIPHGFSWDDLRHPVASVKRWGRSRWNASRTDVLTFLRLRQPTWASDELLTCVTRSLEPSSRQCATGLPMESVLHAHEAIVSALRDWRTTHLDRSP